MKTFGKLAAAFGLLAAMASPALAQNQKGGGGFGRFGGGGGGALLSNKGVQKELKATDEQAKKLDTLAEETRSKAASQREKLADLSKEDRQAKMREMMTASAAELNESLAKILEPDQVKRFHQIQTQQMGVMAFNTPRVSEALKLTGDQKDKIREINQESGREMREAFTDAGDDRQAAMKKVAELRKGALDKVLAVLTDDQKSTYKKLTGDPYEVKFERPEN